MLLTPDLRDVLNSLLYAEICKQSEQNPLEECYFHSQDMEAT